MDIRDIHDRLSRFNRASVFSSLTRMTFEGRIERLSRGVYRLPATSPKTYVSASAMRDYLVALKPGHAFRIPDVVGALGCGYAAVDNELRPLMMAGIIRKVGHGVYARGGREAPVLPAKIGRTEAVRRLMATEDRVWLTSEIQAAMEGRYPRFNAHYVLHGSKDGRWFRRVGETMWRLETPPAEATPEIRPEATVEAAGRLLSAGGTWDSICLGRRLGISGTTASLALGQLVRTGSVVHVALGYYKARGVAMIGPAEGNRAGSFGLLVVLARSWPGSLRLQEAYDMVEGGRSRLFDLRDRGYVVRTGYGRYGVTEAYARALVSRMAPGPDLPALTELGVRVVGLLPEFQAMTRTEIADRLGVGRGSTNRMVERLLREGRLIEVDGRRLMAV